MQPEVTGIASESFDFCFLSQSSHTSSINAASIVSWQDPDFDLLLAIFADDDITADDGAFVVTMFANSRSVAIRSS